MISWISFPILKSLGFFYIFADLPKPIIFSEPFVLVASRFRTINEDPPHRVAVNVPKIQSARPVSITNDKSPSVSLL